MGDSELDKLVLSYDKYIELKDKFDQVKTFSSEIVTLDDILKEADITGDTKRNYLNAYKVLLQHIHNDGLFYSGNNPDACKYINYILYKEVEYNIGQNYDENLKSNFKKILDVYGKKHNRENRCISDMYIMQSETYNKIKPLYELYDKNKECKRFSKDTIGYSCETFEKFFSLYDGYMISTQSKSSEFNKILENIEKYAEEHLSLYRNEKECKNYKQNLQNPRLFKDVTVKKPETHDHLQKSQIQLKPADSMPQYETHAIAHKLQTQLPEDISISELEQENPGIDEENRANVDHIANYSHRGSSHQATTYPHLRAIEEKPQILSRFQPHFRHSYPSGTSSYSGQHEHVEEQTVSKEEVLSPPSFMNTITSTLKNVDPVPVVGVSGGMGALFLLFRYTPVGTFFRGRGFRQRIPTRFDGGYTGFIPGFQGFEEGYFPNDQINIAYGRE